MRMAVPLVNNHGKLGRGWGYRPDRRASGLYACGMTVTNSVITGNLAQGGSGAAGDTGGIASGGGINNDATFTATITNCVVLGNKAVGGAGGAEPMAALA